MFLPRCTFIIYVEILTVTMLCLCYVMCLGNLLKAAVFGVKIPAVCILS